MFLGSYPLELGAITPVFYAFRERETLQAVMEEVSGGRMHYMFNRVGGLKEELPAGWTGRAPARDRRRSARRLPDLDGPDPRQRDLPGPHPRRRACCRREPAAAYGVSGPIARASGLDLDLRRDEPYLGVRRSLDVPVVTRTAGDCHARFECLLEQVHVSLDLADACLDRLTGLPPGRSTSGCRRCSRRRRGPRTPGPRTRSASTATTWSPGARRRRGGSSCARRRSTTSQALSELLPGRLVADMVAILGSMFFVVGDIDK